MKTFIKLAAIAAITLSAATAFAQTGNGSDVSGPAGLALGGGAFVPLPAAGGGTTTGGGASPLSPATINAISTAASAVLAALSTGNVTSPITNSPIGVAAAASVYALVTSGSPTSVAAVGAALTNAGLPAAQANAAVQAMAGLLAGGPVNPVSIISASVAFNALVAAMTPAQLANPPAEFLAMHAALAPLAAALSR
jgi:hypothetical protein